MCIYSHIFIKTFMFILAITLYVNKYISFMVLSKNLKN